MKLLNNSLLHCVIVIGAFLASPFETAAGKAASDQSGDPGWPREKYSNGTRLLIYQPQVDDWKNFQDLSWRMAVSLTPKGGKEVVGVVEMKGSTEVDNVAKVVIITNPEITGTYFPSLDQATKEKMEQLFKGFVPPTISISLHRLIASVPKQEAPTGVQLNNDPPKIFVGYRPSILLSVDGEPALSEVPKTNLKFVVNTQWPLFFDSENSSYYLAVGQQWLTTNSLDAQWSPVKKLPRDMSKVPQDKQWSALKKIIPPPAKSGGVTPAVFYSDKPAEVILFDGQPVYAQIPDTQLTYATNTNSVVFVFTPTQQFYYLTAGRWFRANDLEGPWTYATPDLPPDFAKIPPSSPASAILASVPGTDEAKDAVLLAQVETSITFASRACGSCLQIHKDHGLRAHQFHRRSTRFRRAHRFIMSPTSHRPRIPTARFKPAIQRAIWADSSSVPRLERSLPMGVDITGRHTSITHLMGMRPTILGLPRTAELIMGQLTTTRRRELTAGHRLRTARTDRRREEPPTIPTLAPPREELRCRRLMEAEVRRRPTIRTPEPTLRRDKVRARTLSGAAPTSRGETKVLRWAITPPLMEQ
ncbi:MAG: hypothetical protein DME96_14275 [Verrucomicrobia bacterium]|nr:MAG: hypothetical protein DME96_14275 [Verrucomicrobiota bacterium]